MSFNPIDFYRLASLLYEQEKDNKIFTESYIRTTISRAYYSAFLVARAKSGITKFSNSIHTEVHKHYSAAGKTRIANNLDDLRIKRTDADYEMNKNLTTLDSGKSLRLSRQLLCDLGVKFDDSEKS